MTVAEKLNMDKDGLIQNGPITIVAFGDSVTHGAFEKDNLDYENVYWRQLARKLSAVRDYVPINVINAGIGGINAALSVSRIDRDVLCHHPDLVIVCFGLNDINDPLDTYLAALREIFCRCRESGAQVIFMTPNMLNTRVDDRTQPCYLQYAAVTADYQNGGRMDTYMNAAVVEARQDGVTVCDCYAEWKRRANNGEDTTALLANHINHPTREMHTLFADMLFATILGDGATSPRPGDNTMTVQAVK